MSQTKSTKPKSPPVPSYSLQDTFADAKKLYEKYSHASFSKAEMASALDLSSDGSSFKQKLFTLKEFGLIDTDASNLKMSERFYKLDSNKSDTPTFKQNAYEAILDSSVFSELLNEFKTKLPDQNAVAKRLETQKKFNANRAKEAAATLEKSMQFAGVLDSNNNIVPVRDGGSSTTTDDNKGRHEDGGEDDHLPATSIRKSEVPLANGRTAIVSYPHDLTKDEAAKIGRVLSALVD